MSNKEATDIVTYFDVGVWIGGISCGLFSDFLIDRRRVIYMLPSGILSAITLGSLLLLPNKVTTV